MDGRTKRRDKNHPYGQKICLVSGPLVMKPSATYYREKNVIQKKCIGCKIYICHFQCRHTWYKRYAPSIDIRHILADNFLAFFLQYKRWIAVSGIAYCAKQNIRNVFTASSEWHDLHRICVHSCTLFFNYCYQGTSTFFSNFLLLFCLGNNSEQF